MARGVPGGYRIWDTRKRRWWGDHYEHCPDDLLTELNGNADQQRITDLMSATDARPGNRPPPSRPGNGGRRSAASGMLLRQYVYFALKSEELTLEDLTTRVGLPPDRTTRRGSRRTDPPIPVCNIWEIVCETPGMTVDDQVTTVIDRLEPLLDQIAAITHDPRVGAVLQIVRELDVTEPARTTDVSQQTDLDPPPTSDPGALLGWHLDRRTIEFLNRAGCELDVDEYLYDDRPAD